MNNKKTVELESLLQHASYHQLSEHLSDSKESNFIQYFDALAAQYQSSKSAIIQHTNMDRTYAYQILQGKKQGSKDKIFQFALALTCTLEECNRLLKYANKSVLYPKNKRDSILIYALLHKLNIYNTNALLVEYELDILQ